MTAPMMQVRNGDGYDLYYYLSDGAVDPETGDYIPGWANSAGEPLEGDVKIEAGTAYWLVNQYEDETSVVVSGQVVADATTEKTFSTGWNLSASPYPTALAFSEIDFGKIVGPAWDEDAEFTTTAPMMQVRNGDGYDLYYYLSDGAIDAETGDYVPGWANSAGEPLENYDAKLIGSGAAFWIVLPEAGETQSFTATFKM